MQAGYLGLGAMGAPMARRLAAAGMLVGVWNRTSAKSDAFAAELSVICAATPAELAQHCEVLLVNVSADEDVLAVIRAAMPGLRAGSVVIDQSTVSPQTARILSAELDLLGVGFLDAPVSGGVEGAKNGTLSQMVGGDAELLARMQPLLQVFGSRITHMGAVGQGQATKAVNQVMIAGIAQGVCEALALAEKLELPQEALLSVLTGGAAH